MIFKNTFKLLFTNFSLTYKVFLHKLFAFVLALSVAGTVGMPFLIHLKDISFIDVVSLKLVALMESLNIGNVFLTIKDIFLYILDIIGNVNLDLLMNFITSFSIFVLIFGLIGSLDELAVIECLNANLTSKTRLSFFKCMIAKTFKSFLKSIIKFVVGLFYVAVICATIYFGFTMFDKASDLEKVLIPTIMFLIMLIASSIHLSLIAGFTPSIIVQDEGVLKSLKTGFNTIRKKYLKVLSSSFMLVFILLFGNILISVYSFFAGLIITLPITFVILALFKTIAYYECSGMRYYVIDQIRSPRKKEEMDRINKLKYII